MIDIYLTNLDIKSQLKKAVSTISQQNHYKRINEEFSEIGLFCRKIVKRDLISENLCNQEEAQKNKKEDEEKKQQKVDTHNQMNKIIDEQKQDLILECQIENSIQYISGETLIKEINNPDLVLYDCRYLYEFQGGHIKGAIHMNHSMSLFEELFSVANKTNKIIVLYCEYSVKRSLERYFEIRKLDRNTNQYPQLTYNNLYLLSQGYSEFYKNFPQMCNGCYIQMNDTQYKSQMQQELQERSIIKQKSRQQQLQKKLFIFYTQ
ncbi:unnamed protein product [Paramecium sonneborni]|uniref:Rhodanese domain-containing protein n=1 Tax=Paramecium sonneborni TaxID=65129 RepID=A0A8S1RDA7_9CILI|nr:unnamed protein product [Paramecium sonneborni]